MKSELREKAKTVIDGHYIGRLTDDDLDKLFAKYPLESRGMQCGIIARSVMRKIKAEDAFKRKYHATIKYTQFSDCLCALVTPECDYDLFEMQEDIKAIDERFTMGKHHGDYLTFEILNDERH